jgi:DNA-binding HxlR family transcriptional regulator
MRKIEDYVNEVPEEIRRAIRGLDSDYRTAIFVALYKHGELSFSELQKMLEMDKAMLNYHLGVLVESALVHHYYKHELGTEKYSFYNITTYGQGFLEILSQVLRPSPQRVFLEEERSAVSTRAHAITSLDWTTTNDANVICPVSPARHKEEPKTLPSTT